MAPTNEFSRVRRVLIVQDDLVQARNIRIILENAGLHVLAAVRSGVAGFVAASAKWPDVVLIDGHLRGDMDALELAELLTRDGGPAIVFLAADVAANAQKMLADRHPVLQKPFTPDQLLTAVQIPAIACRSNDMSRPIQIPPGRYRHRVDVGSWRRALL